MPTFHLFYETDGRMRSQEQLARKVRQHFTYGSGHSWELQEFLIERGHLRRHIASRRRRRGYLYEFTVSLDDVAVVEMRLRFEGSERLRDQFTARTT